MIQQQLCIVSCWSEAVTSWKRIKHQRIDKAAFEACSKLIVKPFILIQVNDPATTLHPALVDWDFYVLEKELNTRGLIKQRLEACSKLRVKRTVFIEVNDPATIIHILLVEWGWYVLEKESNTRGLIKQRLEACSNLSVKRFVIIQASYQATAQHVFSVDWGFCVLEKGKKPEDWLSSVLKHAPSLVQNHSSLFRWMIQQQLFIVFCWKETVTSLKRIKHQRIDKAAL